MEKGSIIDPRSLRDGLDLGAQKLLGRAHIKQVSSYALFFFFNYPFIWLAPAHLLGSSHSPRFPRCPPAFLLIIPNNCLFVVGRATSRHRKSHLGLQGTGQVCLLYSVRAGSSSGKHGLA